MWSRSTKGHWWRQYSLCGATVRAGDQASSTAKCVDSDLHGRVSGTGQALPQKMRLSLKRGGAASLIFIFLREICHLFYFWVLCYFLRESATLTHRPVGERD